MKRFLSPLVLVGFCASTAHAQETTLVAAWRGVVAHNPEYAAARARREAGAAARESARALWLPTLNAEGGVARRDFATATTGAQFSTPLLGTSNGVDFRTSIDGGRSTAWALVAQQPIIDADREADARAARARADMADAQFRMAEQALMVKTAETFAGTIEAGVRLRAVQRRLESAARARDEAQARFDEGDLPVTEWREAQAQADELAVQELDARQALDIANAAYASLTGLVPPALPADVARGAVTARPADATATISVDEWLRRAKQGSPAIAVQLEQRGLAEAELRRWSSKDGLRLNLVGQFGRDSLLGSGSYGDAGATQRLSSLGLKVTLPLFSGGMRAAQRHAADASLRAASAELESAQQSVDLAIRSAWLTAANARARVQAVRRAGESAESRLDATRVGHEAGERTVLDLLQAEGAALEARARLVGAQCHGLLATLRLSAAAGALDEAALQDAVQGEFACGEVVTP